MVSQETKQDYFTNPEPERQLAALNFILCFLLLKKNQNNLSFRKYVLNRLKIHLVI